MLAHRPFNQTISNSPNPIRFPPATFLLFPLFHPINPLILNGGGGGGIPSVQPAITDFQRVIADIDTLSVTARCDKIKGILHQMQNQSLEFGPSPTTLVIFRYPNFQMLRIVLDTNVFSSSPHLKAIEFWVIQKLAKAGVIGLHVPFIVENEFISQQRLRIESLLSDLTSNLGKLARTSMPEEQSEWVKSLFDDVQAKSSSMAETAATAFKIWLNESNAAKINLSINQVEGAFGAYFSGLPPLKKAKNREEIPDSLIYQAVKELAGQNESDTVVFVSADNNLRNAITDLPGVKTYPKLSEFVSECVAKLIDEEDPAGFTALIEAKLQDEAEIVEEFQNQIKGLIGKELLWTNIEYSGCLNNTDEAMISSEDEPKNITLELSELEYYGDGKFAVPFSAQMETTIIFYIDKADYWAHEDSEQFLPSVSDHNDHVLEAENEVPILVKGRLIFDVEQFQKGNGFKIITDDATIDSIESVEVLE